LTTKKEVPEGRKLKCIRFSGIITPRKKLLGKPSTISNKIFLTSLGRIQYLTSQSISNLESRGEILFRGEGCDTSGVQPLDQSLMCELCVYSCLKIKNFQCKIRSILVIMKNYKSMFAKSFVLGSNFNFVKGFIAIWPKVFMKLLPKSVSLILIRVYSNF